MSAYNRAAYNLAAYNTSSIYLELSETAEVNGTAVIIACISVSSKEQVTGLADIIAGISTSGKETITGEAYPDIAVYIEADEKESITGVAAVLACISVSGKEQITGLAAAGSGRGILPIVHARMGIYYADPYKDAEIWQLILEAKEDLISSGWPEEEMISGWETEMAITAICVHCLQSVREIDDDHAYRILRGLQTKAAIRKARAEDEISIQS
ncbi:MAG: hypothetical protein IKP86_13035 [Anaerolineaceae bacterium]|nr:hypothetical protein [Anaerolineaceae bacterium]